MKRLVMHIAGPAWVAKDFNGNESVRYVCGLENTTSHFCGLDEAADILTNDLTEENERWSACKRCFNNPKVQITLLEDLL